MCVSVLIWWFWLNSQLADRYGEQGRDSLSGEDVFLTIFFPARNISSFHSLIRRINMPKLPCIYSTVRRLRERSPPAPMASESPLLMSFSRTFPAVPTIHSDWYRDGSSGSTSRLLISASLATFKEKCPLSSQRWMSWAACLAFAGTPVYNLPPGHHHYLAPSYFS